MNPVIVLHASLPAVRGCLRWGDRLLLALPYARSLELAGRSAEQREASLAGIALVLMAAERITGRPRAPGDLSFPLHRKPAFAGGPEFSISHSVRSVACCVANGTACGIDIEDLPPATDAAGTGKLRRWTATEALLKAAGRGIRDLREVVLDQSLAHGTVAGGRFELQPVTGLPWSIGHVATRGAAALTFAEVDLDGDEVSAALERSLGLATQLD